MKRYIDYADPFLGNGEVNLPTPYFPASAWHFIKGLSGNTTPAACLPFGKYSVHGYNGAYPGGCGYNKPNYGFTVPKLYDSPCIIGLSHFQQSGTGAIGVYYNYVLTHPFHGKAPSFEPYPMTCENAVPGYYSASADGFTCEATVSKKIACHRYTLGDDMKLAIDFANDGLLCGGNTRGTSCGTVRFDGDRITADIQLSQITIHIDVILDGFSFCGMFDGDTIVDGMIVNRDEPATERMGCILTPTNPVCELRIAISPISSAIAKYFNNSECRGFDNIASDAADIWEKHLSLIEIETDSDHEKSIFYSNLYHSLIKPCDFSGEAFLFDDTDRDLTVDLATMWDIYKTQLPLLYTLYPDISRKILNTLQRFGVEYGYLPHCLLLSGNLGIESKQARMLAEYTVCDAFYRGIEADYNTLLELSDKDALCFPEYFDQACSFASHTLDIGEAYNSLALVADRLGRADMAKRFREAGQIVFSAFSADGMMRPDSDYYEGTRYNYSFRSMHNMRKRLSLFGDGDEGVAKAENEALLFFGYDKPEDTTSRFEGYNNETDMEAPVFLHDIGRRDLYCEVITAGCDCMFTAGRGGIPGNADSGGLTSCYIWNAIGLFPVSGQDRIIVGSPRFKRIVMHLDCGDFTIEREGYGIYTKSAMLDGQMLDKFEFPASRLCPDSKLLVHMTNTL